MTKPIHNGQTGTWMLFSQWLLHAAFVDCFSLLGGWSFGSEFRGYVGIFRGGLFFRLYSSFSRLFSEDVSPKQSFAHLSSFV